jgi:hypothetical protein
MKSFQPTREQDERGRKYRFLDPRQIEMIDEALQNVGAYGEVRLVVEKGRLRFVVTQTSHDALLWQPGETGDSVLRQPGSQRDKPKKTNDLN